MNNLIPVFSNFVHLAVRPRTHDSTHDCLLLPPIKYKDGGKVVRVITLESENMTRFFQDIQQSFQVEVRSKHEINAISQDRPMLSVDALIPNLSIRQQEAILMAWESGYYEIPRETTTEELAERMGVDRRTYEEHLRLAEHKFIGALVEYLFNSTTR